MKSLKEQCLENVGTMLKEYNIDASSQLYKEAMRHSETLYETNLRIIAQLTDLEEEFYIRIFQLYVASYLIDSSLDLKNSNEWEKPIYLFAGMKLVADFQYWILSKYSDDIYSVYEKYYNLQLSYQVMEKQWEMPMDYINKFSSYENYHFKQIILMFPFLLLNIAGVEEAHSVLMYRIFKLYYSIVLALDDYYDAKIDICNKTLTPISVKYYLSNNKLPDEKSDISAELSQTEDEIFKLIDSLISICKGNEIDPDLFLSFISKFADCENYKLK